MRLILLFLLFASLISGAKRKIVDVDKIYEPPLKKSSHNALTSLDQVCEAFIFSDLISARALLLKYQIRSSQDIKELFACTRYSQESLEAFGKMQVSLQDRTAFLVALNEFKKEELEMFFALATPKYIEDHFLLAIKKNDVYPIVCFALMKNLANPIVKKEFDLIFPQMADTEKVACLFEYFEKFPSEFSPLQDGILNIKPQFITDLFPKFWALASPILSLNASLRFALRNFLISGMLEQKTKFVLGLSPDSLSMLCQAGFLRIILNFMDISVNSDVDALKSFFSTLEVSSDHDENWIIMKNWLALGFVEKATKLPDSFFSKFIPSGSLDSLYYEETKYEDLNIFFTRIKFFARDFYKLWFTVFGDAEYYKALSKELCMNRFVIQGLKSRVRGSFYSYTDVCDKYTRKGKYIHIFIPICEKGDLEEGNADHEICKMLVSDYVKNHVAALIEPKVLPSSMAVIQLLALDHLSQQFVHYLMINNLFTCDLFDKNLLFHAHFVAMKALFPITEGPIEQFKHLWSDEFIEIVYDSFRNDEKLSEFCLYLIKNMIDHPNWEWIFKAFLSTRFQLSYSKMKQFIKGAFFEHLQRKFLLEEREKHIKGALKLCHEIAGLELIDEHILLYDQIFKKRKRILEHLFIEVLDKFTSFADNNYALRFGVDSRVMRDCHFLLAKFFQRMKEGEPKLKFAHKLAQLILIDLKGKVDPVVPTVSSLVLYRFSLASKDDLNGLQDKIKQVLISNFEKLDRSHLVLPNIDFFVQNKVWNQFESSFKVDGLDIIKVSENSSFLFPRIICEEKAEQVAKHLSTKSLLSMTEKYNLNYMIDKFPSLHRSFITILFDAKCTDSFFTNIYDRLKTDSKVELGLSRACLLRPTLSMDKMEQ